jgi:hypothetical protein
VILSPEDAPSILITSIDVCYLQGERVEDLENIRRSFGDAFGIKREDPKYFMGYSMEIETLTNISRTLTITQPDFVEDMQLEFGSHLSAEQAKYKEMGVLTLTGKPLWLSQRCYNMLLFGVTQLYSIKSKPSQRMYVECRTTHAALAAR